MSTLKLPESPALNAVYEANGVVYTWDGSKWKADSSNITNLNGGQLAGFRNQLINGDFRVWERGDGPIQAQIEMLFGPDRWRNFSNANNQLKKLNTKGTTPPGFDYACRVNNTAGAGYSNTLGIAQPIELDRAGGRGGPFTKGSTWTYSCISNAPSLNLDVFFGTGSAGSTDSIVADQALAQTAYDGTWFRYTYQITFPDSDPNGTANCLVVRPRTTGQASWDITGCQLEPGPVATPFEHRPIGTELALCQRYYQKADRIRLYPGSSDSTTTNRYFEIPRPVTMRVKPTEAQSHTTNITYPKSTAECHGMFASVDVASGAVATNYTADAEL